MSLKYKLALCFAQADAEYADQVREQLMELGVSSCRDVYHSDKVWKKGVYEHYQDIYHEFANYIVMFISEDFERELWNEPKRRKGFVQFFNLRRETIMTVQCDETVMPKGIVRIDQLKLEKTDSKELATQIKNQVEQFDFFYRLF